MPDPAPVSGTSADTSADLGSAFSSLQCNSEPAGCAGPLSVVDTLLLAKRELVFIGGCVVTDRPDLPLAAETAWVPDFSCVVKAIDDAIDQMVGADRRTDPECSGCSTCQPTRPISARTKYVLAHLGSRMAEKGRS